MIALALAATIGIESALASASLRRSAWLEATAIQLTTWPVAQWLVWHTGRFWLVELGVVVVEALLWRAVLLNSSRRAALVSIATNGVTAMLSLALF